MSVATSLPPLVEPVALAAGRVERLSRNIALPQLGLHGQGRLAAARVLVVGAGGLGSPVLHYLAAAGVGTLGIVDFDRVDASNLQRQVIHRTASIGELKTSSAARAIGELDSEIRVVEHAVRLDRDNALHLFAGYDIVVDGSDNFATRYLANDAAALLRMPYVWGSVLRFDGQVTVFWEGAPAGPSIDYRDVHPIPPTPGDVLSCDEAGVLGSVCATIGSIMASETVKIVCGIGAPLIGRLVSFDGLNSRWREIAISRRADRMPVTELIDYEAFCGNSSVDSTSSAPTITAVDLSALMSMPGRTGASQALHQTPRLIDVREASEREISRIPGSRHVPLAELLADPSRAEETLHAETGELAADGAPRATASGRGQTGPLVVYCASGQRSARAVDALRQAGVDAVSLAGGIRAWESLPGRV